MAGGEQLDSQNWEAEQPKGRLAGTAQGEVSCLKLPLAFVLTHIKCEKPVDPPPPESQPVAGSFHG